jgi:hypothetical protein
VVGGLGWVEPVLRAGRPPLRQPPPESSRELSGAASLRRFNDLLSAPLLDLLKAPALPPELGLEARLAGELRAAVGSVKAALYPAVAAYLAGRLPP